MRRRKRDPRAEGLVAQRPPADAVSYVPPLGRPSLIIRLIGADNDRFTRPGDRGLFGYTDRLSYRPGEEVRFHTSTSAARYAIEIARVGAKREVVWTRSGIPGTLHPTPADAFGRGCGWPDGFAVRVPTEWRSGYYAVTLRAEDATGPLEWDHFFVVRAPAKKRTAKILMVLSTNTYAAYNAWGGKCLYASDDRSVACRLSFQRPWQRGLLSRPPSDLRNTITGTPGFGERPRVDTFQRHVAEGYHHWTRFAGFHTWESIFVPWMEAAGYALDYCVQGDLDRDPTVLDGYRLLTTAGHDEYWSWPERDAVDRFVAGGGNAAFFIGNAAFWQVRLENDGQEMVCYKYVPEFDPVYGTRREKYLTGMWANPRTGRPETETFGLSFTRGGYHRLGYIMPRSSGGYMVYRPGHWVFAGTTLEYGDVFGDRDRIVGYECDGLDFVTRHGLPYPTGRDGAPMTTEILALAPASLGERPSVERELMWDQRDLEAVVRQLEGRVTPAGLEKYRHGTAAMVTFTRGKGTVFNCGSTEWVYGLQGRDPFVERITRNVVDRLSS
jgi:N,N-dimethylformamidase beta subunit-like protein